MAIDNIIRMLSPDARPSPEAFFEEMGYKLVSEDKRSLELPEIDCRRISRIFVSSDEKCPSCRERHERIKKIVGLVPLHPFYLVSILRKPFKIPLGWRKDLEYRYTNFDGAVFKDKDETEFIAQLFIPDDGDFQVHFEPLHDSASYDPSAMIYIP